MPDSPSLASLAAALARQAAELAAAARGPLAPPPYLALAGRAREVDVLAGQVLRLCVQQSRDAGHTWQEIGDLLGVTRQAIQLHGGIGYTDEYDVGLFLRKAVEPLARALPAELLASFARNLNHAVSIHSKNPDDHSNDYSDVWRPNIEHASHPDTLSETVSALIAAIKFIVGARENGVRLVFDALEDGVGVGHKAFTV